MTLQSFFYSDFAYSRSMELILFVIVNLANFIFAYIVVSLFLALFAAQISQSKKLFFACSLVIFQILMIYIPYALSGFQSLGTYEYLLATPNPVAYIIEFFICNKMFKIAKHRMINMLLCIYLFALLILCISRIVNFAFFQQSSEQYNYMIDAGSAVASAIVIIVIYAVMNLIFRHKSGVAKMTDNVFSGSLPKNLLAISSIMFAAYAGVSFAQITYENDARGMLMVTLIIILSIIIALQRLRQNANAINLQNNAAHINTLNRVISDFRAVKHDFYNILGTYSGYITIDDLKGLKRYHEKLMSTTVAAGDQLDLAKRMDQNPTLCSLLILKSERAEKQGVTLSTAIHCAINNIAIDNFDLSRILSNLLDNAIEAACEAESRSVSFSIEEKKHGDKLIVVSNAVKEDIDASAVTKLGFSTKENHSGIGLVQVRDIVSKYPNCALHLVCYDLQFSAYVEIKNDLYH